MSGKVTSDPSRRRDVAARGNRNVGALAEEHARAPTSLLVPSRNALDARSFPRRADSLIFRYSRHRMHNESASLPVGKKRSASSVVFGVRVRIESNFHFCVSI
jgi:hypothetical protein